MNKTKRPANLKTVVVALAAVIALAAILHFTGLASFGPHAKIMYSESKGGDRWSARYLLLTGAISRTIHLGDADCALNIAVETKSGTIHLKITGADGTSYFDREDIPTSTYRVPVKGTVTITAVANGHHGSFSVEKQT